MSAQNITVKVDVPDGAHVSDYILVAKVVTDDDVLVSVTPSEGISVYDHTAMLELAKGYQFDEEAEL